MEKIEELEQKIKEEMKARNRLCDRNGKGMVVPFAGGMFAGMGLLYIAKSEAEFMFGAAIMGYAVACLGFGLLANGYEIGKYDKKIDGMKLELESMKKVQM